MRATRRDARAARKLYRLCLADGLLDESRARAVVRRVIERKRRGGLGALSHFQRLIRMDRDRHTANVESAVPLSEGLREHVQTGVTRTFGRGVTASFTENAALIAGMRLRVGSEVYDGSVRARLAAIESRL